MMTPELQLVRYGFPEPDHPYYHVRLSAALTTADTPVVRVRANGRRVRDFSVHAPGVPAPRKALLAGEACDIVVRLDWHNGEDNRVEIDLGGADGEQTAVHGSRAPALGGYWDSRWGYYASVVLYETAGLPRAGEPVHLLLNVYASRLADPEREVRVVAVDPLSGVTTEVPSQVYGVSLWDKRKDEHCQPTITFEVAFFADVPPGAARVYLIFYGNGAAAAPRYSTDLAVQGEGLGLTVENSHYRVQLHPQSGVIDEILLKQGVNVVFDHHLETNGALHWNPDVYAPPRTWIHTSDWDPPAGHGATVGPIFATLRRWGPLPEYPEVVCSVTYTFYANTPYVEMSSSMDVLKDLDVQALRNGEIVVNHNVVREFAWKKLEGAVGTVVIKERPRHPTRGLDLPARTPWWAFFNRDIPCALAALNLELAQMRGDGGRSRWEPYIYMHWGPWAYCARPLVYTFATPNPQRVAHVPGGSSFYERTAILPCRLGAHDADRFRVIEETYGRLEQPLTMTAAVLDIDPRTPEEWTPPLLVAEFEEIED